MALDDASAGDDEPGGIESEAAQCARRLADQHPLIAARGPGHVAEPLDRMHHRDATATLGRTALARYRLQPWRATRPSIPS